jgi:hypothetical protein
MNRELNEDDEQVVSKIMTALSNNKDMEFVGSTLGQVSTKVLDKINLPD